MYTPPAIDPRVNCSSKEEMTMMDIILVAGGLALFAVAIAYAFACDRL